jgi:hypothetical protein
MKLSESQQPSSERFEKLKRIQAKGRKHYIFHRGILRFGIPLFFAMTLWRWRENYRWDLPPRGDLPIVCGSIVFSLALWLTLGYFLGAKMWKQLGFETSNRSAGKDPDK